MNNAKKIGICVTALTGAVGMAGLTVKAMESMKKKWFSRGFETGKFIGTVSASECFAHEHSILAEKYNNLCADYEGLEQDYYDELHGSYDDEDE